MNAFEVCPWTGWESPVLNFCEATLCAWIRTPSNAFSSLAFCVVGIIILRLELAKKRKFLLGYGPMCILIGLLSFFNHASVTRIGEIADLSSMFLIGIFYGVKNSERFGWLTLSEGRNLFWALNIICTALLFWIKDLGAPLFFVQCMTALFMELRLQKMGRGAKTYKYFKISFFVWISAQTIWFLDLKRIVCFPDVHWISGHAIWHILMAMLAWFVYLHYTHVPLHLKYKK